MSESPLFANQAVKREELHGVSEPVPVTGPEAHITVTLEVRDVPLDSLRDLLDQLTFGHRLWHRLVVPSSELPVYLLPLEQSRISDLYAPALTLPFAFHPLHSMPSTPSQPWYWKGTLETGSKGWVVASESVASGTYMNPDCYPTLVFAERKIVLVIDPPKVSVQCNRKFYPKVTVRGEGDGLPRAPVFLSVAARVREQGYRHSRIKL